jgi:hypothetical protein
MITFVVAEERTERGVRVDVVRCTYNGSEYSGWGAYGATAAVAARLVGIGADDQRYEARSPEGTWLFAGDSLHRLAGAVRGAASTGEQITRRSSRSLLRDEVGRPVLFEHIIQHREGFPAAHDSPVIMHALFKRLETLEVCSHRQRDTGDRSARLPGRYADFPPISEKLRTNFRSACRT